MCCEDPSEAVLRQLDQWGSHISTLQWAVAETQGPILEVGSGFFSTAYLASTGRTLWTVETQPHWRSYLEKIYSHKVMGGLDSLPKWRWGIAFIDPVTVEDRGDILDSLDFDIGVIHDWPEGNWGRHGPHKYWQKKISPFDNSTTIVDCR